MKNGLKKKSLSLFRVFSRGDFRVTDLKTTFLSRRPPEVWWDLPLHSNPKFRKIDFNLLRRRRLSARLIFREIFSITEFQIRQFIGVQLDGKSLLCHFTVRNLAFP